MPSIAEIANAGPNQPIVGLQATVKSCFPPKPFGQQGTFQNAVIADQSGEIAAQFIDVEVHQGEMFMATSSQTTKRELGQERAVWDGAAYTEIYKDKFRFTIKRKGFRSLSAPAGQLWPGGPGVPAQSPALAPGGPLGPAYGQAQPAPLPAGYQPQAGQPGAFPGQIGQRPDPGWATDTPASPEAWAPPPAPPGPMIQVHQPLAPAWQSKPKMTVEEVRVFLLAQFVQFTEALGREWAAGSVPASGIPTPLSQLPPEVVVGAMAWSTSILIAYQRGDVVDEPAAAPATPGGSGQAGGGVAPEELNQTLDIAFGG